MPMTSPFAPTRGRLLLQIVIFHPRLGPQR